MRLISRLRTAQTIIAAQAARIRELEQQLNEAQDRARAVARPRNSNETDELKLRNTELEKEAKQLARSIDQLRAGTPDDALVARLRHDLHQERAQNKGLEQRVADLQAANSRITTVPREAA